MGGGGGGTGFPSGMVVPHHLQGNREGMMGLGMGGGEGGALEKSKLSQAAWFFKIIALEICRTAGSGGGVSSGRRSDVQNGRGGGEARKGGGRRGRGESGL